MLYRNNRPIPQTDEEKAERARHLAALAAKREQRKNDLMHCQCCQRAILANTGLIAHHGYTRPDIGWQTSSCMGARELPWEVDRAALDRMIVILKQQRNGAAAFLRCMQQETIPCTFRYSVREKGMARRTESKSVTRANFADVKAEIGSEFTMHGIHKFDDLKEREVKLAEHNLGQLKRAVISEQSRYDRWKATHKWRKGKWEKLK